MSKANRGRQPDHRAAQILDNPHGEAPEDPLGRYFFHFVKTGEAPDDDAHEAAHIYMDPEFRHVLDALLLAEAKHESIIEALKLPPRVLDIYASFFFDVTVFPHNMAKTRYVRDLLVGEDMRQHYIVAITRGPEEVLRRYRVGWRPKLDPQEVTHDILSDVWSRFTEHRGRQLSDKHAQAALQFTDPALRAARQLNDMRRQAADTSASGAQELRIALEVRETQASPLKLGIDLDDLVKD